MPDQPIFGYPTGQGLFSFNPSVNFLPVYRHVPQRIDAYLNLPVSITENLNDYIPVDND